MNRAAIVVALAAVTFVEGTLGAVIVSGVSDLNASALQTAALGAAGASLSVLVNGLGRLHTYLAKRNDA